MSFSSNLKLKRVMKGLTQEQMAERLEIKVRRYAYWENGTEPGMGMLVRICDELDTTPNELLGYDKEPDANSKEAMLAAAVKAFVDAA